MFALVRPRGATPGLRSGVAAGKSYPTPTSGAAAKRSYPASEARDGLREELPRVRGQGRWPGGDTPCPKPGTAAGRGHPASEVKGDGQEESSRIRGQGSDREEQPHAQGGVAVWAQEGLEEPSHVEGQEGWWEEIRSSKVRSSGCALLEQL